MKDRNFVGTLNGKPYDIPVETFKRKVRSGSRSFDPATLRKGDWFYTNEHGKACLYKFDRVLPNGKIVGLNPIGNIPTTMSGTFIVGKVEQTKEAE